MIGGREIKVVLSVDDSDLSIKMVKAGETVKQLTRHIETTATSTKRLEDHFMSLGTRLRDATLTISMLRFAVRDIQDIFLAIPNAIIKSSAEIERMTVLMRGLSREVGDLRDKEAKANVGFVFNMAKSAPFEVKALGDAFVKLKVGGIDPTNGSMQALVDSIARFGGSGESLKRAAIAIQQMGGKGVISMEELRQQLGEAVPDAMQALAVGVGMSMQELTKVISKGSMLAAGNIDRMFAILGAKNAGAAAEMMNTWGGMTEQLKTKWTLFTAAVGENGFFEDVKKKLGGLLAMFDTQQAQIFANNMGRGMTQVLGVFERGVELAREYGNTLLWVAGIIAAKSIGERATERWTQVVGGKDGVARMLRERQQEWTDKLMLDRRNQAIELQEKVRANEAMIAENAEAMRKESRTAQAESLLKLRAQRAEVTEQARMSAEKIADLEAQAVATKASVSAQITELARLTAAEELRRRAQQGYANVGGGPNKITRAINSIGVPDASQKAAIASTEQRIAAERELIKTLDVELAAERKKAAAVMESVAAQNAAITATRASANAITPQVAALGGLNSNLNAANAALVEKAQNLSKVTFGMRMLTGALAGAQSIFSAFGGWVTVAVVALTYLGEKLYSFLTRWKEAENIRKQIDKGLAPDEDQGKLLDDRIREKEAQIARAQAKLNSGKTQATTSRGGIPIYRALTEEEKAKLKAEIDADQKWIDDTRATAAKGADLRMTAIANDEVGAFMREMDAKFTNGRAAMNQKVAQLEAESRERLKTLKGDAKDKEEKELGKKSREEYRKEFNDEVNWLIGVQAQANAKLKRASENPENKQAIISAQRMVNAVADALKSARQSLAGLNDTGEANLGAPKSAGKELPITKLLERARYELAKAKIDFEALEKDARGLPALQNKAAATFLEKIEEGALDHKDDKGNTVQYAAAGRKKFFESFSAYLKAGRTDIDDYINSLKTLTKAEKEQAIQFINDTAQRLQLEEGNKAVSGAVAKAAEAQLEYNAALENYATQTSKTPGFDKLQAHFDRVRQTVSMTSDQLAKFNKEASIALAAKASADAMTFANEARQRADKADAVSAVTVQGRIDAERDAKIKALNEEAKARRQNITKSIADEAERAEKLRLIDEGVASERKLIDAEYFKASKTELEKLREEWQDTTQQMNQMTANWGSGFINAIVQGVSTGRMKFGEFVKAMAQDVLSMTLKKNIGNSIASMFDGIGTKISVALGMSGPTNAASKAAADALAQAAATKTATAATTALAEGMSSFTTGALAAQVTQTIAGTTATAASTTAEGAATISMGFLASASELAASSLAAMSASSAANTGGNFFALATSFFANGGIMTSRGSVPLNFYENGGIADRPQMAIFGEGKRPEAYVPLPDGRSIPVTVSGPISQGQGGSNVVVNVINQTSQPVTATQGQPRLDGKQLILDVVLSAAAQPGAFRDGMRNMMGAK